MKRNKSSSPYINIIYSLVVFVAGAMIGTVLQEVFAKRILLSLSLTLVVVFSCLVLLSLMMYQLIRYTSELRYRVGIKITYIDRDRYGRANLFKEARQVVETAEQSILVLNSYLTEIGEVDEEDEITKQECNKYYEALLERATKEGVIYERILQLKNNQSVADLVKGESYFKHFHRMFDEKDRNPNLQIGLIKAPAKRLSTFVLLDDERLLWQINEILPSEAIRMHGIFIIEDPRREITRHFREFFESIRRDSLGAVHRSELPPLE